MRAITGGHAGAGRGLRSAPAPLFCRQRALSGAVTDPRPPGPHHIQDDPAANRCSASRPDDHTRFRSCGDVAVRDARGRAEVGGTVARTPVTGPA